MAVSGRAFMMSRVADLRPKPLQSPPQQSTAPFSHHLLIRPLVPSVAIASSRRRHPYVVSCLISGVDGGGVSDDFVSTRKSGFDREFSVIANMLKRIEPLDNSVIAKGVSDSAKDAMKQTISSMLGLLPSDQFSVTINVSKHPLDRLIVSSIITGYTLWNAEYRILLMRNFDISLDNSECSNSVEENGVSELKREERTGGVGDVGFDGCVADIQGTKHQNLGSLSPEALSYIQQLESELHIAKQELGASKQANMQIEFIRESNNDLLEYLRSLDSDMVIELSRPSSSEVEEIIHQLAQRILQRFFKDETVGNSMDDSSPKDSENYQNGIDDSCDTIDTSRDYLAKLLFWCMLLGHHLRGLENRLHLSCVVGLL